MHTRTWGKKRNPLALMIHGLASSSNAWEAIAPQLAAQGYYVIAPDLPGHGKSRTYDSYSVETMADAVHGIIGNRKVDVLIGHSLGGLVSILLAAKLNPRKLALLDPVIWLPPTKFLLNLTQNALKNSILDVKNKRAKQKAEHLALFEKEFMGYKTWDMRTVAALESRPNAVKQLLSSSTHENLFVLRVKNSVITPASLMKKYAGKLTFHYVCDAGHNVHQEKAAEVWELLREFIGDFPAPQHPLTRLQAWLKEQLSPQTAMI